MPKNIPRHVVNQLEYQSITSSQARVNLGDYIKIQILSSAETSLNSSNTEVIDDVNASNWKKVLFIRP